MLIQGLPRVSLATSYSFPIFLCSYVLVDHVGCVHHITGIPGVERFNNYTFRQLSILFFSFFILSFSTKHISPFIFPLLSLRLLKQTPELSLPLNYLRAFLEAPPHTTTRNASNAATNTRRVIYCILPRAEELM